jgi:hypothetical protein
VRDQKPEDRKPGDTLTEPIYSCSLIPLPGLPLSIAYIPGISSALGPYTPGTFAPISRRYTVNCARW